MYGRAQKNSRGKQERGQEAMLMPKQFHCYLVQKTESVFHPAKLASGANYPVGWVQMPHSVRSARGCTGQGQRLRGVEGALTPRCAVSVLVSLWPQGQSHCRAEASSHWDFTQLGFFFVRFFLQRTPMLFCSRLQAGSHPVQPQPSAGGRWADFNKRLRLTWTQTKPICEFLHDA